MGVSKKYEWMGLPLLTWVVLAGITVLGMYSGKMGTDFGSTIFWLTVIGAIIMGVGNQLRWWTITFIITWFFCNMGEINTGSLC